MPEEKHEVSTIEKASLSTTEVIRQTECIMSLMKKGMTEDVHYGLIPGCKKPSLYQPGADKLCLMFRMDPQFDILSKTEEPDFIAYTVQCTLYHITTGQRLASAVGSANSRESTFSRTKNVWDQQHNILTRAQKRAKVYAVRNATAASDIFTDSIEDMPHVQEQPTQKPPLPAPSRGPTKEKIQQTMEDANKKLAAMMSEKIETPFDGPDEDPGMPTEEEKAQVYEGPERMGKEDENAGVVGDGLYWIEVSGRRAYDHRDILMENGFAWKERFDKKKQGKALSLIGLDIHKAREYRDWVISLTPKPFVQMWNMETGEMAN